MQLKIQLFSSLVQMKNFAWKKKCRTEKENDHSRRLNLIKDFILSFYIREGTVITHSYELLRFRITVFGNN